MIRLNSVLIGLSFLPLAFTARGQNLCSTEKVNHDDCTIYISRRYPVTLPTIQMKPGREVNVQVRDTLPFETLTLDWTSGTALPPTDQGALLVTSVIPDLKGLYFSNTIVPAIGPALAARLHDSCREQIVDVNLCFATLQVLLLRAHVKLTALQADPVMKHLPDNILSVYSQLNQVLSPIPKPGSVDPGTVIREGKHPAPLDYAYVPPYPSTAAIDPWTNYPGWRQMMLCELAGVPDSSVDPTKCPSSVPFTNLLGVIATLQAKLPATTPQPSNLFLRPGETPPPPDEDPNQLFDQKYFDFDVKKLNGHIDSHHLQILQDEENILASLISVLSNTLSNVQKDFVTYYQNIALIQDVPADMQNNWHIYDPALFQKWNTPVSYHRLLGRQVVYTVNAVNQISTPRPSITATAAKIPIATITVLYGDPIFETSAGGLVSFVHNRSFANQTVIAPQSGTSQVAGDVIISQTKTDPEVVPFVAAHWRLGPDFTMPDLRRGAVYATAWVGLNPYTSLPEYGAGPTLSWRSFMVSALYNRAHVVGLTAPQIVGEIVCSPTAVAGATPPPCTPAPPAPITQTYSINAFAIGISIRLPTTFTAGTGGVSH